MTALLLHAQSMFNNRGSPINNCVNQEGYISVGDGTCSRGDKTYSTRVSQSDAAQGIS